MRNRFVYLASLLVLGAVVAMGQQPWENPGTTTPTPDCSPFGDQYDGSAWYCVNQGTFPWFAAGGGWTTMLRIAAPQSGAIRVVYDFSEQANGSVDPVELDYKVYGSTTVEFSSKAVFPLSPNQPLELTLLGRHSEAPGYQSTPSGSVHVEIDCPDKATCAAVTPQLIYSYLPAKSWFLSGTMSSEISLPSKADSNAWSVVGVNNPQSDPLKSQFITFAILNDSGIDQQYTVTAYNANGVQVGTKTTDTLVADQSTGKVLQNFLTTLPAGLVKLRVTGGYSIFTALQFNGPAATALVPVAEGPAHE